VTTATEQQASWAPLAPRERRVVGVLAEKAKTTPDYYPMTLAALLSGCNQKSNRDPVTEYDEDDVEEALQALRKKGAVILVDAGGRALRWKHQLYDWLKVTKSEMAVLIEHDWLKVTKSEMAVLIELLLRGPQTEGDLRARASRMEPLPDLAALQTILQALSARGLVHYLSPPGQKRGVFVTHGLYPVDELEKVRLAFASRQPSDDDMPAALSAARADLSATASAPGWVSEVGALRDEHRALRAENAALRAELEGLRAALDSLATEVRDLKTALGA
jgi:uncharacterized protein YceH (UPF0502 family)